MNDKSSIAQFVGPRAIEFRFRFATERDANNFADAFDDAFEEVDSVGITHDRFWTASAIAPAVQDAADAHRLSARLAEIAKVNQGQPDGVLLFD